MDVNLVLITVTLMGYFIAFYFWVGALTRIAGSGKTVLDRKVLSQCGWGLAFAFLGSLGTYLLKSSIVFH